ncbi:MAG: LysM peptidoglycan-binding domain-containing protein [Deltaproteobacteria bacterium]|nr:LysM peptidoglycan-binding domain-containing protein [Deltaproteobacteria bacterium]
MGGNRSRHATGVIAVFVFLVTNSVICRAAEPASVPLPAVAQASTGSLPAPGGAAAPGSPEPVQAAGAQPQAAPSGPGMPQEPVAPVAVPSKIPPEPVPVLSAPPETKAPDRVLLPGEVDSQVLKNRQAEDAETPAGLAAGAEGQDEIPQSEEDVPPGLAGRVKKFIRYFQSAGRKKFELWLSRSGKYSELMRGILEKYGLPGDLVYLALIESGFSPNAYSVARAAGPWQFIAGTAKRYGLRIDWWADERRDYEKSTHAAASYLKDLYGLFESWDLAAAAYNAGEGKIIKAVSKSRSDEYADLIRGRYLKQETKDYVPKMYAALSIAKEPAKYGFGDVQIKEPLAFDKVEVPGGTDLAVLGTIIGLSADAIHEWNPELRRFCTPPNRETYELRLPRGYGEVAQERMAEIRTDAKITFLLHRLRKGESLEGLSGKYRVPVATIREMNGLRTSRIGRAKRLVIPVAGLSAEEASPGTEISPEQLDALLARAGGGVRKARSKTWVAIRRGDTLVRVAARAGVSAEDLARANGLKPGAKLRAGRTLRLPPHGGGAAPGSDSGKRSARHIVRAGETLWKIAKTYGVTVAQLAERNNLSPGKPLRKGRVLLIPSES